MPRLTAGEADRVADRELGGAVRGGQDAVRRDQRAAAAGQVGDVRVARGVNGRAADHRGGRGAGNRQGDEHGSDEGRRTHHARTITR